jgi:hypothetical protein
MSTTLERGERTERQNEDQTDDEVEMTTCRGGSEKAAAGAGCRAPVRVVVVSSALTLAVTGAVTVLAGCSDQPKANCLTSTASYAMKLIEMTPIGERAGRRCRRCRSRR